MAALMYLTTAIDPARDDSFSDVANEVIQKAATIFLYWGPQGRELAALEAAYFIVKKVGPEISHRILTYSFDPDVHCPEGIIMAAGLIQRTRHDGVPLMKTNRIPCQNGNHLVFTYPL